MVSLLAAAAASCTREIQAPDGAKATLTVTASLDAAMDGGTKASADGGLTNLAAQGGYSLRYNMELWSHDGETMEYKATPKYIDITDNMSMSVEYNLNLLAKKYKMVLWADIVKKDDISNVYNGKYDISDGLTAIEFREGSAFGSDEYDAFTAVADVDLTGGSKVIGATLKRPFAKIRVIDMTESDPGTEYTTKLTFANPVSIPWKYNAITGDVTSATNGITETPTCTSTFEEGQSSAYSPDTSSSRRQKMARTASATISLLLSTMTATKRKCTYPTSPSDAMPSRQSKEKYYRSIT